MKPTDQQIRVPSAFKRWMSYPATLDIGTVSMLINVSNIAVSWTKPLTLKRLPRFEDGDRFGRLVFVIEYAPGSWAAIHGEHMRKQGGTDETGGATLEMWAAPDVSNHTTLGQTMRAKSKDSKIKASGYEPALPIGVMVVTHDRNPTPQRTPVHWFGFPDERPSPPRPEPPPTAGQYVAPNDAELAELFRRASVALLRG